LPHNRITTWRLTRFQFRRDRVVGDSQVRFDSYHMLALELSDGAGRVGLGFAHAMWDPFPALPILEAGFEARIWPGLDGRVPQEILNRVTRPRGGNQRDPDHGFGDAIQIALWDLAARQAGLPLARFLGAERTCVRAYASGLDFHMTDAEFEAFFATARSLGFTAFKIKVGHPEPERDLHRLDLLRKVVGPAAGVMIDANEAWSAKEAQLRLSMFRKAGHELIWVEDPILRHDFEGLRALSAAHPWTQVNAGEYLDLSGRARLLMARGTDIINLHGRISDVMRTGWLAAELGIPVSLGNTALEIGVHAACALPEVPWLEYSFQNHDFLVDAPYRLEAGRIHVPDAPGHGLSLSETARKDWAEPEPVQDADLRTGPACALLHALPA
jgi:L-alanine-DL-glutamate epimerase-like enolase superfamily enzyme